MSRNLAFLSATNWRKNCTPARENIEMSMYMGEEILPEIKNKRNFKNLERRTRWRDNQATIMLSLEILLQPSNKKNRFPETTKQEEVLWTLIREFRVVYASEKNSKKTNTQKKIKNSNSQEDKKLII